MSSRLNEHAAPPAGTIGEGAVDNFDTPETGSGDTEAGNGSAVKPRRWVRGILLALVPAVGVAIGGYQFLTGGRYVETDNAYVKSVKVSLSAQISGVITDVLVEENERVAAGRELFRIDAAPFRVALDRAQARLLGVRSFIESLKAGYYQKLAELKRDQIDLEYNEREYNRQLELSRTRLSSPSELDRTRHEMEMARQQTAITRQALDQIAAQLGGVPDRAVEDHALYLEAHGAVADALLNIERTTVTAPFSGVAQKKPEPGQYVRAGEPVMVIVADQDVWIEANFKETELTYVTPGQPARVWIDAYPDHEWRGEVQSLSQASGAEFSLLPPQNATGNWVKVVQRIPVRIAIETQDNAPVLRSGMSVTVRIDTRQRRDLPKPLDALLSRLGAGVDTAGNPQ
jgi:membrane fusion protein (multidrug efflux system)